MITMPDIAYVSIFMDNDLTHITEDPFDIKLIARLLDQIYVIQPPMLPPRYDDAPPQEYEYSQLHDPGSRNYAMLSAIFVCNINSSELHFQSVALRSQYSDHAPEAVTLH